MPEENNNSKAQKPSKKSVSIGALLANARTIASLNQTDVAEQIKTSKRIIQALESDDYASLPESTYIRGYLRNYARVVGINSEGLIKLYDEQHYQKPVIEAGRKRQSYDPTILWSTAAVLTILVGLIITWWFDNNPAQNSADQLVVKETVEEIYIADNTGNELQPDTSTIDNPIVSETENILSSLDLNEPSVNPQENADNIEVISAVQQEAMEEASRNPNLVTSLDGAQVLTVTYMEKSWTEIRDADANTLMQGLIEPGVVRNLSGKPPFEIFLGNAPGVVIEVNGSYFDHSSYSRSNRTARFQISSSSFN